jgi:hypothetical protein
MVALEWLVLGRFPHMRTHSVSIAASGAEAALQRD